MNDEHLKSFGSKYNYSCAPIRYSISEYDKYHESRFGDCLEKLKTICSETNIDSNNIIAAMSNSESFRKYAALLTGKDRADNEQNNMNLINLIIYFKWLWTKSPLFHINDNLNDALLITDIGKNCPCEFFKLPFPKIYIEFGSKREMPFYCEIVDTEKAPLEGVFISETITTYETLLKSANLQDFMKIEKGKTYRTFEIVFTGSPINATHILDDVTNNIPLTIIDENESIMDCLKKNLNFFNDDSVTVTHKHSNFLPENIKPIDKKLNTFYKDALEHLAKILIHLNSNNKRLEYKNDKTELLQKITRLKSKGKQKKYIKKLRFSQDIIVVSSDKIDKIYENNKTGKSLATHWRRGHLREQAYGSNRALRRSIWIEPTLIGFDNGITPKDYTVK